MEICDNVMISSGWNQIEEWTEMVLEKLYGQLESTDQNDSSQTADVIELCRLTLEHFVTTPIVLSIHGEICIVGDLHGSFHDLVRIFRATASLRGSFSLRLIVFLLTLMLRSPDRFILLCSNHYPKSVFDAFCGAFAWIPIAAVVQDICFCARWHRNNSAD
jgi:serine/threonine-protein phosphatase PP1 catalytic subunit